MMPVIVSPPARVPRVGRITIALWLVLVLDAGVTTAALIVVFGARGNETLAWYVKRLITAQQAADSWRPMERALEYLRTPDHGPLYQQVFFAERTKFQYPPTALLFVDGVSRAALRWLNLGLTVALALLAALLLEIHLARAGLPTGGAVDRALRVGAAIGLSLTFYPAVKAFQLGQIQVWLNTCLAGVLLAWTLGRQGVAGLLLGLMCVIKPTYLPLLIWGAFRKRRVMVAAAGAVIVAAFALSVARFGLASHADYGNAVRHMGARGEVFYANQSFNGLLNRALNNGESRRFDRHNFAPYNRVVHLGTLAAAALVLVAALALPWRMRAAGGVLDLALMTIAVTAVSPVAWEHHYGTLVPIYAAALPWILHARPFGRASVPCLVASYVLTSQALLVTNRLAETRWNIAQSYLLLGALLLAALLTGTLRVRRLAERASVSSARIPRQP